MSVPPRNPSPTPMPLPQAARVVRLALVAGALMFGAVTWYLHTGAGRAQAEPVAGTPLGIVLPALVILPALLNVALWKLAPLPAVPGAAFSRAIVHWSLGNVSAVVGAVHYFVSGSPSAYVVGVCILLGTLMLVPAPRAS